MRQKNGGSDGQFGAVGSAARQDARRDELIYSDWWTDKWIEIQENAKGNPVNRRRAELWELLLDVFPNERVIDHAALLVPLEPSDVELLKHARVNLADARRLNFSQIARRVGQSRRTVKQRLTLLLSMFLKKRPASAPPAIESLKFKGERSPRYYRRREVVFGEWRDVFKERIPKPRLGIGGISRVKPYRQSPMNQLFGALIAEFANLPKRAPLPPRLRADWDFNLQRAERLLKNAPRPLDARTVYYALGKRSKLCKSCHAHILRGFKINGRITTRARDFCDDACKMRLGRSNLLLDPLFP